MTTLSEVQRNVSEQIGRDLMSRGIYDQQLIQLMYTGLFEEVGEVAGVFKRRIRKEARDAIPAGDAHLSEELGDVLWYLTGLCFALGYDLEEIWFKNVEKLEERYERRDSV